MSSFIGFDHIDLRVPSLAAVEAFYDRLLPALGLSRKVHGYVDPAGEWVALPPGVTPNVAEYYEASPASGPSRFLGVIEAPGMEPTATRVAFGLTTPEELAPWSARLTEFGARNVEWSSDPDAYPAIFFEDPAGTKLELCARRPRPAT